MRLVLDQGIPRDAAIYLLNAAGDVIHVGKLEMSAATDGEILAVSAASGPSVIRVRIEGLDAPAITGITRAVPADSPPSPLLQRL